MRTPELTAAYERIDELTDTLRLVRDVLNADDGVPDIEPLIVEIDDVLVDKTVLAA